jgi:hypothetical protein
MTTPTDLYDVTILDAASADLLGGAGADKSSTATTLLVTDGVWLESGTSITPTVANAGNSKTGTITFWVRRYS